MRISGNIKVLHDIEHYIKTKTKCEVIKNGDSQPVCNIAIPQSLHKKVYRVYAIPYEFVVQLIFEERNNTGVFQMPDRNSQLLFISHPQLAKMLKEMDSILTHDYTHGEGKEESHAIKDKPQNRLEHITNKLKEKLEAEYFT